MNVGTATRARRDDALEPPRDGSRQSAAAVRTWHAWWFVARQGVLPWAMLLVALVSSAVLATRGAPWRGDLLWIVDWLPIGHVAVAPVVAGAAAIDMARLGVGVRHIEASRWWRSPGTAVTSAYAIGIGAVYVAVIVGAVLVEPTPEPDPRVLLGVGVQLLMLTLFAATGTLVGRLFGPVLGGIVAALAALVGIYLLATRSEHIALLYAGASLVSRVGRSYNLVYLGSQAALLSGLVLALLMARPGIVRGKGRLMADRTVALLAVGAVLGASAVGPSSRLTYTGEPPDLCADVSGSRVCLYPEHARLQGEVVAQLSRLFDGARAAGYDGLVPQEVREVPSTGVTSWQGPQILLDEPLGGAAMDVEALVQDLVMPYHCFDENGESPFSDQLAADAQTLRRTWLSLVEPEQSSASEGAGPLLAPGDAAHVMANLRACGELSR